MSPRPQVNTRLPEELADTLEDFADEHDLSKAEAARRFIRVGMSEHGCAPSALPASNSPATSEEGRGVASTLADEFINYALLGAVGVILAFISPGLVLSSFGWAMGFLGTSVAIVGLIARCTRAWSGFVSVEDVLPTISRVSE